MKNLLPEIRNAVRALIIREGKVLVQTKIDGSYTLPGGAHEVWETLEEGLIRECEEEIGVTVQIDCLLHVGDYFKIRSTDPVSSRHQIEFLFSCTIPDNYVAHNGPKPDKRQVDVVWLEIDRLNEVVLKPASLVECILHRNTGRPVYMGLMRQ